MSWWQTDGKALLWFLSFGIAAICFGFFVGAVLLGEPGYATIFYIGGGASISTSAIMWDIR